METQRLPPIPDELTSVKPDPTTKITQKPDGTLMVHSVRQGVEGSLTFKPDGSYTITSNTGSTIRFSPNNHMEYAKGGTTITIDNNSDIKISGHHRISIDTDAHIEVAKNASIVMNGDCEIYSTGHLKLIGSDVYIGSTMGSVVVNSARDMEMTATQGRMTFHSTGVQTHTTDSGDFHVNTAGMVDITSQLDTSINSQGKLTTQSQSTTTINSTGALSTNSSSTTTINSTGALSTNSQSTTTINSQGNITATSQAAAAINAAGNITTQGAATLLQGGGASSPPITVA